MAEWHDTDGGPVCGDCLVGCPRPAHWAGCDVDGCCCPCRQRAQRAAELDDRPDETLHGLARDMAAESRPSAPELHAERYGDHRTLAAERVRRAA